MTDAAFAVPGDLAAATGGYGYARRLLAEAPAAGVRLRHLALPGGFPHPSPADLAATGRALRGVPAGQPILIDGLALGALPAAMLFGAPGSVVALCHHPLAMETGLTPDMAGWLRAGERAALGACAHVITTSRTTAATLVSEYGVPEDRLTVAPPGTDPAPQAQGSGGPGVAIVAVGTLTPRKGHDLLVAALEGLRDLDWTLTIAGPDDRDPAHAAALRARVAAAGLGQRVRLTGALPPAALAEAYDRADLFALASLHEGFGMVYAEAMAHGLPVVGTTGGAIPEATLGAARLVPPGDAGALRAALAELIGSAAARETLAKACRQAAAKLPRWPDTARIVAQVLRGVAA